MKKLNKRKESKLTIKNHRKHKEKESNKMKQLPLTNQWETSAQS